MARDRRRSLTLDDDPLWYKDAVIYQLHVRAYHDSNADGIGDFAGLTEKLDYLQDLGVTAIWMLPFYPSPGKDDGYDIAEYTDINPVYGEMKDFRAFMREAHERGIRVITELVINHTSDQHSWFQKSRRAKPGTAWREYYVWSDTAEKYRETRIIFKDFETSNWSWDPIAQAYFWHRFYHHQPDLNFDNPAVHKALFRILDFWMEMGVDGLRLDAIPYLYEREGTTCENLPETHEFLKRLREHVDQSFPNRMLLAEANQWPEDTRPYFGDGDECHMAFHFPLMPRLFMSVAMEDRFPIIDIMNQTPDIPASSQWAMFLRNHDELTLEMVTDEDRDYMWRFYAQDSQARINLGIRRRLAPLLGNHRRKIELLNGLLFSFPGTPIIYYGDEIGMGDNIYLGDRHGVRTPMQWSSDRNAGFSRANPQKLYLPIIIDPEYHYEAINVEAQQNNPHSLLWWMKRLIALRKRHRAFGRGTLEFLHPENRRVLAFFRRHEEETILVVANLSRFVQSVELDLSSLAGSTPVEMFGYSPMPPVTDKPYFLTLGPHSFYWFLMVPASPEAEVTTTSTEDLPEIAASGWSELLRGRTRSRLEALMQRYLLGKRWFGARSRTIKTLSIADAIPASERSTILLVKVDYAEGQTNTFAIPLSICRTGEIDMTREEHRQSAVARLAGDHVLFDALQDRGFTRLLLDLIAKRRELDGESGSTVRGVPARGLRQLGGTTGSLEPRTLRGEQSNSSILYGDRFYLKLYRKLEPGVNPDCEISGFLSEKTAFPNTPPLAGAIEYRRGKDVSTLAILQGQVAEAGDVWTLTVDTLDRLYERLLSERELLGRLRVVAQSRAGAPVGIEELEPEVRELLDPFLKSASLLGRRTAEMHLALASREEDPAFAPEPFTPHYQRSIYQHMRTQATRTFQALKKAKGLHEPEAAAVQKLLARETEVLGRFREILDRKITASRFRTHGDYHLGQVLHTGKDFVVIDFEGEPARPIGERRIKRSGLRDVAGMLRSFHYAAYAVLMGQVPGRTLRPEDAEMLDPVAAQTHQWAGRAFLDGYLETAGKSGIVPDTRSELTTLLRAYLLEKALYEVQYELDHRPDWIRIPIRGILQLLEESSTR